ncbi:MAG: hypothetical protein Q9167_002635 [Letrouitia subvulpina]
MSIEITVGVLALQGAFHEHIKLLHQAAVQLLANTSDSWRFVEVRTPDELTVCDALIIPGGESTTLSLVAARSGLLEPLREFVKTDRKPTWGTCAGLILLAESANRTKKGGQDLIGGLDVRVSRNYFGRQADSFEEDVKLPFLSHGEPSSNGEAFRCVFIRAPVVEKILPSVFGEQKEESIRADTVIAPAKDRDELNQGATDWPVEILANLPSRVAKAAKETRLTMTKEELGDIIAVRQRNVFGTSFHPELTTDARIHTWWLRQAKDITLRSKHLGARSVT